MQPRARGRHVSHRSVNTIIAVCISPHVTLYDKSIDKVHRCPEFDRISRSPLSYNIPPLYPTMFKDNLACVSLARTTPKHIPILSRQLAASVSNEF